MYYSIILLFIYSVIFSLLLGMDIPWSFGLPLDRVTVAAQFPNFCQMADHGIPPI